jgi:hypothetical protein
MFTFLSLFAFIFVLDFDGFLVTKTDFFFVLGFVAFFGNIVAKSKTALGSSNTIYT